MEAAPACRATSGGSPDLALRGSPASTWTRESVSSTHGSCERLYAVAHAKDRVSGSPDAWCTTRLHTRAMSTVGRPTSRRLATQESTQQTVVESWAASAASASSASRRTASDCSGRGMTRNVALPGCSASLPASWCTAARRESSEPAANLLGSQVGATECGSSQYRALLAHFLSMHGSCGGSCLTSTKLMAPIGAWLWLGLGLGIGIGLGFRDRHRAVLACFASCGCSLRWPLPWSLSLGLRH